MVLCGFMNWVFYWSILCIVVDDVDFVLIGSGYFFLLGSVGEGGCLLLVEVEFVLFVVMYKIF